MRFFLKLFTMFVLESVGMVYSQQMNLNASMKKYHHQTVFFDASTHRFLIHTSATW